MKARNPCNARRTGNRRRNRLAVAFGASFAFLQWSILGLYLLAVPSPTPAATVLPGFAETIVPGPSAGAWNEAVGITFDTTGRMFIWERAGRVWFKDPADSSFSLLLNISEEVGDWGDLGCLGFTLDPNFRQNGYIYLLYTVDRHYLLNFGSPNYNPNSNDYNAATIGRVTRYTCRQSDGFRSADPASRLILIGETKQTGIAQCSDGHGIGSLVFGDDGTLLVSCGDGGSAIDNDIGGTHSGSFAPQALTDGIIRPKEDVGAFRAQLVDCLNGKILRIDPATGNGIPSNPFFNPANPRAPQSRVWAMGFRNPFRMTLRAGTGSHNPADGKPGVLYVGNVGWYVWESLKVVTQGGQNFGWPIYEGLGLANGYPDQIVYNQDAPNPLYPATGCSRYFQFRDLLKEDTTNPAGQPPFNNPCNSSQKIPSSILQFLHTRPVLDWSPGNVMTRTPIYDASGQAQIINVGAPGSPVSGVQFIGNCSVGGAWYTANAFPTQYQNTYFHADWGAGVIKNMRFDQNDKPQAVADFLSNGGSIVCLVQHPFDGSLYYVSYTYGDAGTVRQLGYAGNRTPVAAASADNYFGATPLSVQFSSTGSSDPDNQPLTYSWNFGDNSPLSTLPNPSHTFSAPAGVPTKFNVTLTVTDPGGLSAQSKLVIVLNDTPPDVTITSPANGASYSSTSPTTFNLTATVNDAESSDSQLSYQWQTLLHHNDHNHVVATDTNHATTTVLSPIGCDGINIYYYRVILTVTDPPGLATTREVRLYPNCATPNTPPTISDIPNQTISQDRSTGPLAFTIGDNEIGPINLQLSGTSSNPTLVPGGNIIFGGSGSNRTVTVTPVPGQTGTATITVTVTDGPADATDSFLLTVNPAPAGTLSVTNSTPISLPVSGAGNPYPSIINIGGLGGVINNVTVTLRGLTHTWPDDFDILLVSPSGQKVMLFSDVGGGNPLNNVNVTLSDAASFGLPDASQIVAGTYKPTDFQPGDVLPAPAPPGPYANTLSSFNGQPANGPWALYVLDDGAGDQGSVNGGWSLTVTAATVGPPAPTISDIPDQATTVNTPTAAIPFTIGDPDTPVANLILSSNSSNATLVPPSNIIFGGSGSNRTVTVTPASGQTGTAIISVSVSDGTSSASDSFVLTVNSVNTPPTISALTDQAIDEDISTGPLGFTIGDAETAAASLSLSKGSSNPTLVPPNNIVFGGSASNRTVTVTPATNQNGTATITVNVSDGQYTASTSFVLTVNAVNDPPTISTIANQSINVNTSTGPLNFTIADVDTPIGSLIISSNSSNPTLVPLSNIALGGSGANRTVTVTPASGQTGSATITLSVSDGQSTANSSFVVTVSTLFVGTRAFTNGASITIVDASPASAYPSTISVAAMGGSISNVTVSLRGVSHTWPDDLDILLVSPTGQKVMVMSDAGGGNGLNNVTFTLSDAAATALPDTTAITAGTFRPADYEVGDVLPAPAPPGPYPTSLSSFNGQSPNGTWSLYVSDDGPGDVGSIAAGWSLSISTVTIGPPPPTISDIPDQATTVNTPTAAIPFTIGDPDTPVANLTLSSNSSNATLVPPGNIVFGGSGSNRTVTITPASGQTGTATITVTVSDGTSSASDSFVLTVNAVNTPPTISALSDQTIDEDTSTGPLGFTIGDAETAAGSLSLSKGSSNPTLVPLNNIVFGGSASNRTVTVTPATNQNGTATITVNVSDGQYTATTTFVLTVNAVNDPPTISTIANQSINVNSSTGPLNFTIGDVETPVASLVLSNNSSNPTLVPAANITFGGSGANRTVTVTPAAGQTGTATITLSVNDGQATTSSAFVLTVNSLFIGTKAFTNATALTIPDSGPATLYPSTINVAAMGGVISNVTVSLRGLSHTWPDDLDILLVGPNGQKALLMSDAGGGNGLNNVTITLSDAAATALPDTTAIASGTFRPADYEVGDVLAAPAPTGPYSTPFSAFNGQSPNGAWSLYVFDDGPGDLGSMAGGWSLTLSTASATGAAPTVSDIPDQLTTVDTSTAAIPFTIGDVDTPVSNLTLGRNSSNLTLVPTNNIVFGGSGTNLTVTITPASGQTGTSTITVTVSDGANSASDTFLLTVNSVNTPPTISSLADQVIDEDGATAPLSFTIGDAETAPASLTLSKGSSNPTLVPASNIVFGGSGANRTVTVTPASNQNGTATISVNVSDGQYTATATFLLTVNAVNDPPTISAIANQNLNVNSSTGPLSFTIGDVDSPVASLTVSSNSSNPTLVPPANIVIGGSGANRTVTVTPASGQSGNSTITLTVSDGQLSVDSAFLVTVTALPVGTKTFTNTASITIPDSGAGSVYPSTINVAGMGGAISNATVTLRNLTHTWPDDIDILLVGPSGQKVLIMSDAGGGNRLNSVTIALSDTGAAFLPDSGQIISGTFKPTNFEVGDTFPAPAPAGPYSTNFTAFAGSSPNGAWSLFVNDDGPGDVGVISGGWVLTITTTSTSAVFTAIDPPDTSTNIVLPTVAFENINESGEVTIRIDGLPWEKYVVEASEDMTSWKPIGVVNDPSGTSLFTDSKATAFQQRFYRLSNQP